jgi:putative RNA 2'-phosphotransferase
MSKQNSRFLSLVLRHKPETIKIKLDKNGWVAVDELLAQLKKHNREMSMKDLRDIVEFNDKKRFEFNEEGTLIRAAQGHSVKVDLQMKPKQPPRKLYHGTVAKTIDTIMDGGLKKMNRHAVHLSEDITTATKVGSRRGEAIILEVNSAAMYVDKIKFFKSKNGVWLTDEVPSKYIKKL